MSDVGTRKRSRREIIARKPGDEERWASSAQPAVPTVKVVTIDERRNVMRNLPDPKHFPEINSLMKSEVKKDIREMERELLFTKTQTNSSDDEVRGNPPVVMDTVPPQILAESSMQAKKKRYTRWDATPQLITDELATHQKSVEELQSKLVSIENEKQTRVSNYHFVNQLMECHVELLGQDKDETEGLLNALTAIAVFETMPSSAIRRRRFSMKEVMEAWQAQVKEGPEKHSSNVASFMLEQQGSNEGLSPSAKLLSLLQKLEPDLTHLPSFLVKFLDNDDHGSSHNGQKEEDADLVDQESQLAKQWLNMQVDGKLESLLTSFSGDHTVEHYLNILTSGKPASSKNVETGEDDVVGGGSDMVPRDRILPQGMAIRLAEASNIEEQLLTELETTPQNGAKQEEGVKEEGNETNKPSAVMAVMAWSDCIAKYSTHEFLDDENKEFQDLKDEQATLRAQLQQSTLEQHGTVKEIANLHKDSSKTLSKIMEMKETLNQLKKLYPEVAFEDASNNSLNNEQRPPPQPEQEEEEDNEEEEEEEETQFGSFPTTTTTPSGNNGPLGGVGSGSGLSIASPSILAPSSSWSKATFSAAEVLGSVVNAFRGTSSSSSSSSSSSESLPFFVDESVDETESTTSQEKDTIAPLSREPQPNEGMAVDTAETETSQTESLAPITTVSSNQAKPSSVSPKDNTVRGSGRASRRTSQPVVEKDPPPKRNAKRKASTQSSKNSVDMNTTTSPDPDPSVMAASLSSQEQSEKPAVASKVRTSGRGRRGN